MLSMVFFNCRTLPGQSNAISRRRAAVVMLLISLLCRFACIFRKWLDQKRDVDTPVGELRQLDRNDFQSMVQVFAKSTCDDGFFQVAVGGRKNADVDFNSFVGTNACDFVAL